MQAQPGPSTHQPYPPHQTYAYSYNAPSPTVSTTSQSDPHAVTYHSNQNPVVSSAPVRGPGPVTQYQSPDALPPYPYPNPSYVATSYGGASVWQSRGTVQQQPTPSSSPPGPSPYTPQAVYSAPSQPPPQSYAGWNPTASRLAPLSYLTGLP